MKTADFGYTLPPELIAQHPAEPRDASRLLVMDRAAGRLTDRRFPDILEYLNPGDCLIVNDSRVLPARLYGKRESTGAGVELLLLRPRGDSSSQNVDCNYNNSNNKSGIDNPDGASGGQNPGDVWEALAGPGRRAKPGDRIIFGGGLLTAEVLEITGEGSRLVRLCCGEGPSEAADIAGDQTAAEHLAGEKYMAGGDDTPDKSTASNEKSSFGGLFRVLEQIGQMPLPHYITERLEDGERYQTVYSREPGSAAAPTAGLHFTPELLERIRQKGVGIGFVTLHVGLGTFRPVKAANIADHHMHAEHYELSAETAALINKTKAAGGRVIAVGTTSCRTLESIGRGGGKTEQTVESPGKGDGKTGTSFGIPERNGGKTEQPFGSLRRSGNNTEPLFRSPESGSSKIEASSGWTDIFLYPGCAFSLTDGLLTNFHLPESTLIMLVSAFAGHSRTMAAYEHAVKEKYRFYSFGDAMLII
ncbi:MAG: S-adenosylmethionine:tRNA ribosyltransferase-isomerase [Oscillospiraceae bacterium]|nr:S-adenosylmethionine:tRNA ribosyltransferase-isomerase [Oscillospiraceae bacterium]